MCVCVLLSLQETNARRLCTGTGTVVMWGRSRSHGLGAIHISGPSVNCAAEWRRKMFVQSVCQGVVETVMVDQAKVESPRERSQQIRR